MGVERGLGGGGGNIGGGQLGTDVLTKTTTTTKKKKKNTLRQAFFQAWQCAALSSFRVGKWYFSEKRVCFYESAKTSLISGLNKIW